VVQKDCPHVEANIVMFANVDDIPDPSVCVSLCVCCVYDECVGGVCVCAFSYVCVCECVCESTYTN